MELELLNDQLRKGQGEAERKAKSQQAAAYATRSDVQKVAERLKAMPKRFTQSLSQLRDEVDRLEREKLSLQLAQQQRTLKVAQFVEGFSHFGRQHLGSGISRPTMKPRLPHPYIWNMNKNSVRIINNALCLRKMRRVMSTGDDQSFESSLSSTHTKMYTDDPFQTGKPQPRSDHPKMQEQC